MKSLSRVRLLVTPWTEAHQAPPSIGFPRQEYWSGVPLPSPRDRALRFKSRCCTSSCVSSYSSLCYSFSIHFLELFWVHELTFSKWPQLHVLLSKYYISICQIKILSIISWNTGACMGMLSISGIHLVSPPCVLCCLLFYMTSALLQDVGSLLP